MSLFVPNRYRGKLIVVEGIDGSGKSTQISLLSNWLRSQGYAVAFSEWNSSSLVRETTRRGKKKEMLTPTTFSLLHATDFADRLESYIVPLVKAGAIVCADRYAYTAFARDVARAFKLDPDENTIPGMNALMAAIAIVVIAVQFPSEAALQERLNMMFPMKTIATMDPSWRTFNWDYVGGMMAFQGKPSFIDSRFDSFDQVGVMDEYGKIMAGNDAIELMKKYKVDHALAMDNHPISYLLEHSPGWTVVRREKAWEGEYILFAKTADTPASAALSCPSGVAPPPR